MKVVIDPGHFPNCANVGPGGYNEGNAMLEVSKELQRQLIRHDIEAVLTRTTTDVALTTRGKMAAGADLFISEHSNAGGGRGVECYYSVDLPGDKEFAMDLAEVVMTQMNSTLRGTGAKTRPGTVETDEDYYTVIDAAQDAGCKHVLLIENGFHDNAQDVAFLNCIDNLKKIAKAQAVIICLYLGVKYINEVDTELVAAVDVLNKCTPQIIGSPDYWINKSDVNTRALIIKTAAYIKGGK